MQDKPTPQEKIWCAENHQERKLDEPMLIYLLAFFGGADDLESVYPPRFSVFFCACGPTLPPFQLAFARVNGAHVFRCGNRSCIRWPLGRAPESRGALRGNDHVSC